MVRVPLGELSSGEACHLLFLYGIRKRTFFTIVVRYFVGNVFVCSCVRVCAVCVQEASSVGYGVWVWVRLWLCLL